MNIMCPFCAENGFDQIGLKLHIINGHCDVFERIEVVPGPFGMDAPRELKVRPVRPDTDKEHQDQ